MSGLVNTIFIIFTAQVSVVVSQNPNEDQLKVIRDWWADLSKVQPLKSCRGEAVYSQEFNEESPKDFWTRPCTDYENTIKRPPFTFRGKIVDHLFQGPGKFKNGVLEDFSHIVGTCVQSNTQNSESILTIVSNFKDGKPEGLAKITFKDGSLLIGHYKHGVRHGLFRKWDSNETLYEVGYWMNGSPYGMSWSKQNDYLIYTHAMQTDQDELIYNTDESLILSNNFSSVIAGKVPHFRTLLEDAMLVELGDIMITDCFLVPAWKPMKNQEQKKFTFAMTTGRKKYQNEGLFSACDNSNSSWNTDEATVSSNLQSWLKLFSFGNFHNGAWHLDALKEDVQTDALPLIHDLREVEPNVYEGRVQKELQKIKIIISRAAKGSGLSGVTTLKFNVSSDQELPRLIALNISMEKVKCIFDENGLIQGMVHIQSPDKRIIVGYAKDGVLHGSLTVLGVKPIFPISEKFEHDPTAFFESNVGVIGTFKNGRPFGPFWIKSYFNGYLYGEFNESMHLTGDRVAFVYPDLETVLLGRFEDMVMKSARESRVVAEKCNDYGVKILKFADPDPSGPAFFFSPPTNETFGEGPKAQDPYEAKMARLGPSNIPGSGEGVFAKKFIPEETLICPLVMYFFRNAEEKDIYYQRYVQNTSLSDDDRRWAKKYSIGVTGSNVASLELPIELDAPGVWHPTLGHKVNSDFKERHMNCGFSTIEHPRWGLIQSVFAVKDIQAGQELYMDYGYTKNDFPADFLWYHEAREKMLKELEEKEKAIKKIKMSEENRKQKKKKAKKSKKKSM